MYGVISEQYDPSAGVDNVLKVHNDVFKNDLKISSVHVWPMYITDLFPNIPIDVVYKSNPVEEKLYIIYDDSDEKASNNMIWNIDGKKNIKLTRGNGLPKNHYELSREQLYELCMATSLMLQVNGKGGEMWEGDATVFLPYLQAVYHEAIDNTMFPDAKNKALASVENVIRKNEEKNQEFQKRMKAIDKEYNWIWIAVAHIGVASVVAIIIISL